ncbi:MULTISPECIES: hypothetical protein [unclassified Citromicrobium]|uniref:hypothetical protein n=1 Tax=unclassified Citromicrobium TaxID=2630544 RepID=UPI000AAE77F3|nr:MULTISPECIES: hypothetical protein [unclassified Citromicrobium]|tara:strand:- start:12566 stop:13396 length:831 start_codon:yes stop_codon:yes gene_type:complete
MGLSRDEIADLKVAVPPHLRPPDGGDASLPNSFHAVSNPLASTLTDPNAQAALVETARQLENGQIESAPVAVATRALTSRQEQDKRKADQRRSDALFITMLDRARDWSRQLGEKIDTMEAGFEAEMGDAWREQIANRVMDPDEIPQRRDGESMEAYRERLEDALVEKMIDKKTGEIKPEYRDDPELRRYAEWAQARHQKRDVNAFIARRSDPDLTDAQRETMDTEFASSATFAELRKADRDVAQQSDQSETLRTTLDDQRDAAASSANAEALAFGV